MDFNLTPPTETTTISAQRVLVLAPHYDDEIFGCGGLLVELGEKGADIRVLYLTDSSGGAEVTENREAYAARRRVEAQRGLDHLGVGQLETLAIPDGGLASDIETAAETIRRVILDHHPDLILSVSPCEITSDHRAAFASLHRALTSMRGRTELDEIMSVCRILLYEVNHPGYPSLLVDVSRSIDVLTKAMDAHESQLQLHNYREAAMGMRHYRALSLSAEVEAAEGYRELGPLDFITHGHSTLVGKLGGIPDAVDFHDGPLVSVVVRTKDRPELLTEALESIAASGYRQVEIVIVNDGGEPPSITTSIPFPVVHVEMGRNMGRAAAANAGVEAATGEYVSFLDDDDLMDPEHLGILVGAVTAPGVRVAYTDAAVGVYELDGEVGWSEIERRLPYSRDFDPELLLVDNYIPFNTLIIERGLFEEIGPFEPDLQFFEDWDFLIRLAAVVPFHHLPVVTAEYRHFRGSEHHILGEKPRDRGDFLEMKATVIQRHRERLDAAVLARVIDGLRGETVGFSEEVSAVRRELDQGRLTLDELNDAYHRINGECESLRHERAIQIEAMDRLETEIADHRHAKKQLEIETGRLQSEEVLLRAKVEEQDEHLARLYAEIERLGGLIETIESTAAWRWHKRVEKLRGRG